MILRTIIVSFFMAINMVTGFSQVSGTKNIFIVTLDGFRWQELFKGADSAILFNKKYVKDQEVVRQFWHRSEKERRRNLMPFLWDVFASQGQLYGNRNYKNKVNCTNHHLISYPGYSEMLVGFRDSQVSSNKKEENPNATVLEFIHRQKSFEDRVAAFTTWDVFPFIFREKKSRFFINAGNDIAVGNISHQEKLLNARQVETQIRSDSLTFQFALEYLKREKPRVVFISLDETDSHAHGGRYDEYLKAANRADDKIARLWQWIQSQPEYRDQTTLYISTDHGRGEGRNNWQRHRLIATGSRQIWFAVIGPDTPAFGEITFKSKIFQNQTAKTIAAFLGLQYQNDKPVGEVIQTMLALPQVISQNSAALQLR